MRIEFKKRNLATKFTKFCEDNGADYFEDDGGIWIIPKKYDDKLLAIRLEDNGRFSFGYIIEECNNFEQDNDTDTYCPEEIDFITKTLLTFKKLKGGKN